VTGTLLNVAAVLVGTTVGTLLGDRLPDRVRTMAMHGVGLVSLLIGMQMALQVQNILIVLASMVLGGIAGELLGIEDRLEGLGRVLEERFSAPGATVAGQENTFVRGFVMSSLVFCVGPLTILGSIQDGLMGDSRLLAVKSLLDGFTSMALGSTLGRGVYFSAVVVLIYQGGLSLAARAVGAGITDPGSSPPILEMTAVGGLLILGISLKLLDIKSIRVGNFLPAIVLAPLFTAWFGRDLARLLG
jgi:uncharacterized protein